MALTDNLQAYYKLDGNSNDSIGSNNGTDTSITYNASNGIIIQGAGLTSASSSKISFAANAAFQPSGSFTLNCWVYVDSYRGDYTGWIGKFDETGNDRSYAIAEHTGGTQLIMFTYNAANDASANPVFTRPATGGWHMLTLVFTSSSQTEAFMDATSQASASASFSAVDGAADPLLINGLELGGAVNYANIRIDEVGMWHRALSGAEITELYNGGAGLQYPFTTPTSIKTIDSLAKASVKTVDGLAIASVKTWNGLA